MITQIKNKRTQINRKNKGQVIAEYALLFVVVVSVMIIAINGSVRGALDNFIGSLLSNVKEGLIKAD